MTAYAVPELIVAAYPVRKDRCPHCGGQSRTWTPGAILDAFRAWADEHGRQPKAEDWNAAGYGRPQTKAVYEVFGSWSAAVRLAGFPPLHTGAPLGWTRERIAEAMLDFLLREGRWPTSAEWAKAAGPGEVRPSAGTVFNRFGSWPAAKRFAGWADPVAA